MGHDEHGVDCGCTDCLEHLGFKPGSGAKDRFLAGVRDEPAPTPTPLPPLSGVDADDIRDYIRNPLDTES